MSEETEAQNTMAIPIWTPDFDVSDFDLQAVFREARAQKKSAGKLFKSLGYPVAKFISTKVPCCSRAPAPTGKSLSLPLRPRSIFRATTSIYLPSSRSITPAFNAGDFTGNSWTVDAAADVQQYEYYLRGRTLEVFFVINNSSLTSANSTIDIKIPGGFTQETATKYFLSMIFVKDNGTRMAGFSVVCITANNKISMVKMDGANWATSANNTNVNGVARFRVD